MSNKEELLVEGNLTHIREAKGMDGGVCPVGMALRDLDPLSKWYVGPQVVCRYAPGGVNKAYDLPKEAIKMLEDWDTWYMKRALGKTTAPFGLTSFEFVMAETDYPDEHLVSSLSLPALAQASV